MTHLGFACLSMTHLGFWEVFGANSSRPLPIHGRSNETRRLLQITEAVDGREAADVCAEHGPALNVQLVAVGASEVGRSPRSGGDLKPWENHGKTHGKWVFKHDF